jgi:hypothetical protein
MQQYSTISMTTSMCLRELTLAKDVALRKQLHLCSDIAAIHIAKFAAFPSQVHSMSWHVAVLTSI